MDTVRGYRILAVCGRETGKPQPAVECTDVVKDLDVTAGTYSAARRRLRVGGVLGERRKRRCHSRKQRQTCRGETTASSRGKHFHGEHLLW